MGDRKDHRIPEDPVVFSVLLSISLMHLFLMMIGVGNSLPQNAGKVKQKKNPDLSIGVLSATIGHPEGVEIRRSLAGTAEIAYRKDRRLSRPLRHDRNSSRDKDAFAPGLILGPAATMGERMASCWLERPGGAARLCRVGARRPPRWALRFPGAPSGGGGDGRGAREKPKGCSAPQTEPPISAASNAREHKKRAGGEAKTRRQRRRAPRPGAAGPEAATRTAQRGAPAGHRWRTGHARRGQGQPNRAPAEPRRAGPRARGHSEWPRSAKRAQAPERKSRGEGPGPGPGLAANGGPGPRSGGGRPAPKRAQPRKQSAAGRTAREVGKKDGGEAHGQGRTTSWVRAEPAGDGVPPSALCASGTGPPAPWLRCCCKAA